MTPDAIIVVAMLSVTALVGVAFVAWRDWP